MNTKQITLNRLKEAYKQTHARHIEEAYKQLRKKYEEATPQQWESLTPEKAKEYDHVRSLLIRAEQLEREHLTNKVRESENIAVKLERHKYAPELNKAHIYLKVNNKPKKVGVKQVPQITTISGVYSRLTDTELKNLSLYV